MEEKTITLRISEDLHKEIKIRIAQEGKTLKEYIVELVVADLKSTNAKK